MLMKTCLWNHRCKSKHGLQFVAEQTDTSRIARDDDISSSRLVCLPGWKTHRISWCPHAPGSLLPLLFTEQYCTGVHNAPNTATAIGIPCFAFRCAFLLESSANAYQRRLELRYSSYVMSWSTQRNGYNQYYVTILFPSLGDKIDRWSSKPRQLYIRSRRVSEIMSITYELVI